MAWPADVLVNVLFFSGEVPIQLLRRDESLGGSWRDIRTRGREVGMELIGTFSGRASTRPRADYGTKNPNVPKKSLEERLTM